MNIDYIEIGRRIRRRRKELGYTQECIAELTNISISFYGHIERGSRKASVQTLYLVCNALSMSTDYVLGQKSGSSDDRLLLATELLSLALEMAEKHLK